jgi:hypothetical protein
LARLAERDRAASNHQGRRIVKRKKDWKPVHWYFCALVFLRGYFLACVFCGQAA